MRKIVSLTSYGERLTKTLPQTLKSISEILDFNPDMIVLYLTENDYSDFDISLLEEYTNLSVRIVDDIKSFKKYYALTESEFENDIVLIVDDDIKFNAGTWLTLNKLYEKRKNENQCYVYAKGCTILNEITKKYSVAEYDKPYDTFLFWSGCGLLIPPQTMRFEKKVIEDMYEYAQKNNLSYISDDKFMSTYCKLNGIKCVCAYTKQQYLDFDGNTKLMDLRTGAGKSKLHWQQAQMYFKTPEAEKIIVSLTTNNQDDAFTKIVSLFENQSLKPDKVILTLNNGSSVKKKIKELLNEYNFEVQKTNYNPLLKKWKPDNIDANGLVFVLDDKTDMSDTLLEEMFCEYFSTPTFSFPRKNKLVYIQGYGHRHIVNTSKSVVRMIDVEGLNFEDDTNVEVSVTKTILDNLTKK